MKLVFLEHLRESLAKQRESLAKQRMIDDFIQEQVSLNRNFKVIEEAIENNAFSRIRSRHIAGTITDEEHHLCSSVKIGEHVWMSKNLNVSRFKNGDLIPQVQTDAQWKLACRDKMPAWCFYENDPGNDKIYGKLYNWHAVIDPRGLAPEGWHLPSDAEWTRLIDHLGGNLVAGRAMKSNRGWESYRGRGGNGNNNSGFDGRPGGDRCYLGSFELRGYYGKWWISSPHIAHCMCLSWDDGEVGRREFDIDIGYGISVRCVRD